jgi:hypothetical protein
MPVCLYAELLRAERRVGPSGEVRWLLTDVIGSEDGLGVECLSGSGAIASAYNRAFRWEGDHLVLHKTSYAKTCGMLQHTTCMAKFLSTLP